jgi:hypothetical protein
MAMIAKPTRRRRPIHGLNRDGGGKLRKELAERDVGLEGMWYRSFFSWTRILDLSDGNQPVTFSLNYHMNRDAFDHLA